VANIDQIGTDLDIHAKHIFEEALDKAWGGDLEAEEFVIDYVASIVRDLSYHRYKYLKELHLNG
jgi:hypothetical protein